MRRCFGRCWRISAANLGCVHDGQGADARGRGRRRLCRERKVLIAERVEQSIASRGCCSHREYLVTSRCAVIGVNGSMSS